MGLVGDVLLAIGFSNLFLSGNVATLLSRPNVYFLRDSQGDQLEGWALAMAILSVLAFAVVRAAHASAKGRYVVTRLAVPALIIAIYEFFQSIQIDVPILTVLGVCLAGLLVRAAWKQGPLKRLPAMAAKGLKLSSLYALTCVISVAWAIAHPYQAPRVDLASKPDPHAVIVWVIFDELDQDLLFDNRPVGLALPNFDALRAQAVTFSNAKRPGPETLLSLPALLCGRPVVAAETTSESNVQVTFAGGKTAQWADCDSIFDSMKALNRTSSLVGFYHNYGSVFAGKADHISSTGLEYYGLAAALENEGWMFVLQPIRRMLQEDAGLDSALNRAKVAQHKECVAAELVSDRQAIETFHSGFIFLHVGLPHGPWIDAPISSRHEGYLSNLVLADKFLGQIRQSLVRAGTWDRATLIVSSDHNLRLSMDGRALNQKVPLLVRLSGQTSPLASSATVSAIDERWLIEAIAKGSVKTPAQVVAFMAHGANANLAISGSVRPGD